MRVFIVTRNGQVDEVFDHLTPAEHHRAMLTKKWAIAEIIEREIKSL
jgi:hypothetical protein